ncbi:hypothetical protein SDC9_117941 [bioreactor metagenome]|uniref:Phage capsid-like C-terminal domain-containing protein n=1 Tax=bioreactor metagenome TaxID=1076179 RepID=A0A645C0X6_9ZZZZ
MEQTIQEIIDAMTDDQQAAVYAMIGAALEEGTDDMAQSGIDVEEELTSIFSDAKKMGSLKDSFLAHAEDYGIEDIDELFPTEKNLSNTPRFITNRNEWVNKILSAVHKLPFSRVKSLFADITADTIRSKGYIKGSLKEEDVFTLMKRTTEPYTIYKKGKLDRDDIIDITDFEVVAWIKEEMRMKLDEELARTIVIGDGRDPVDPYKIDEECIRPVYNDADLYTIKVKLGNEENKYKAFINAVIRSRKEYRGSGMPTLFTTDDLISEILLLEDLNGRKLYNSEAEIKSTLRVADIVTMNDMTGLVRTDSEGNKFDVHGVIVNLADYSVGADRGGQVAMFDDFDIDYNQEKFLIETRCAGALTIPYSAMVIEEPQIAEDPEA